MIKVVELHFSETVRFVRFSFKAPKSKLVSITLLCPESVNSGVVQFGDTTRVSAELGMTTNDGDVNLINDFWKLTKIDIDLEEKRTLLIEQEMVKGQEIQGYVKVDDNLGGKSRSIRVKIYLNFKD